MLEIIRDFKKRILNSRFAHDSFWALIGNILGRGLSLAAGIFVARYLGKEVYGEYGIIKNTILSLAVFSTFGLGYTATKYVAQYKKKDPELLNLILKYSRIISLIVSSIIALIILISADYISNTILKAPHLKTSLQLVTIWIIISSLTTTQTGILAGLGQFKKMAIVNGITGVVTLSLSVSLTYHLNLKGALSALIIAQGVNLYLNYRIIDKFKGKNNNTKPSIKFFREIVNFSFPVALQEVLYSSMNWVLQYLIIRISTYGELGLYTAANQWKALILFIPGILKNVILKHLSDVAESPKKHQRILNNTLIISFISTLIPFIFIYSFSNIIIDFYGSEFSNLKVVLRVLVFSTIFISLSNVYSQAYLSAGKPWLMLGIRSIRDIGRIVVGYYLLKNISDINGALSIAYTQLFISIIFFLLMALVYNSRKKHWT